MFTSIKTLESQAYLPEIGKIKIGTKGEVRKSKSGKTYRAPVKTDHFIVTKNYKDKNGDFVVDDEVMSQLGENPKEIPVRFLYDEIELNYQSFFALYDGRDKVCWGNGETALRKQGEGEMEVKCPCVRLKARACKPTGRLSVILPTVKDRAGVYVFRTHGWNSVRNIMASLEFLKSQTGGILTGITFHLKMLEGESYVETDKGGFEAKYYHVTVYYKGTIEELQAEAAEVMRRRASNLSEVYEQQRLVALRKKQIDSGAFDNDDPVDVIEEYYPENQEGYEKGVEFPEVDGKDGDVIRYKGRRYKMTNGVWVVIESKKTVEISQNAKVGEGSSVSKMEKAIEGSFETEKTEVVEKSEPVSNEEDFDLF